MAALLIGVGGGAPPVPAAPAARDLSALTPGQLAGQRMVFGFSGTQVPAELARRIRAGEAGSVLLLGSNTPSRQAARSLVARLQAIPRPAALDVPLLVMVDQEGGLVRRLPGPPARRASALGQAGPAAARAAGAAAGRLLRSVGANVDLAPVADVARPGSALARDGRIFGSSPAVVSRAAVAFAGGLGSAGIAATAKHFPGLGAARVSTDAAPVRLGMSRAVLDRVDLPPFRALIARRIPMVMTATAIYPALDPRRPAALSAAVTTGLLRGDLGFTGVTITDALDTPALEAVGGTGAVAVRAAAAGNDLLIHSGFDNGVTAAAAIARAIRRGTLDRADAQEAVARTLAVRERFAPGMIGP